MKEWYSSSEIAGLPGGPSHVNHASRWAEGRGIATRVRAQSGGGKEYHFHDFPGELKAALIERSLESGMAKEGQAIAARMRLAEELKAKTNEAKRQASLAELATLPEERQVEAYARLEVIKIKLEMERHTDLSQRQLLSNIVALFEARELDLSDESYHALAGDLSARSIRRWESKLESDGPAALAKQVGRLSGRTYKSAIDKHPALRDLVVGMIYDNIHANARHVRRAALARFDRSDVPSLRTFQRYLDSWKKQDPQLAQYLANPDAWRSRYQPAYGDASEGIVAPNQLDEMDSTPGDVMLEGGRHSLIGTIDVATRRLKLHVVKTSTAAGIASLIRRRILDWGVPETIKTDQGADYTSKYIRRALDALEIRHELCPPFQPEKKPFIERAFHTFSHDLVELLPDFIGHSVADRKNIEARRSFAERLMTSGEAVEVRMTSEEFQEFCDKWCDEIYANTPHEGLNGRTPLQAVTAYRGPVRRIENERALDILLSPAPGGDGIRTVSKKGLRVDGFKYIAEELAAYSGQDVLCLYDEADAGRLFVFGGNDMQFICIAQCPDITGVSKQELAILAKRHAKKLMREKEKEYAEIAKRSRSADVLREIVAQKSEQAAKVTHLPHDEESYSTDFLESTAEAAAAGEELRQPRKLRRENTAEEQADIERLRAQQSRDPLARPSSWDSDTHRYHYVQALLLADREGEITDMDWAFVRRHEDRLQLPEEIRISRDSPGRASGM